VKSEAEQLQRYVDGELSPAEACAFKARLEASPELRRRLSDLVELGSLLRAWASSESARAPSLLEPTLARVKQAEARRRRRAVLAFALAVGLPLLSPTSVCDHFPSRVPLAVVASDRLALAAAIERLEAADPRAQVFLVGRSSTPVVWLADDVEEEASGPDPG
jgi:anti-sigma factor RsiW